jgi:TRAP-type C4-dicarboxylate transport system substrate-binding protein
MLTVNNKVMESFSPEDRKIIKEAALEAAGEQLKVVRKGLIAPDLSALKILEDNGMEVTVLDQAMRNRFKTKTLDVYQKWVPKIGEELVKNAEKAIAATR